MPYMYEIYPVVHSVQPPAGSLAGGTLLTIRGRGFPELSTSPNDSITISLLGGGRCAVVTSTYDTITCLTGPKPPTVNHLDRPVNGLYPAMRGAWHEHYATGNFTPPLAELWKLNSSVRVDAFPGSYRRVLMDAFDAPMLALGSTSGSCTRTATFFVAPRNATYRFLMQGGELGVPPASRSVALARSCLESL